MSEANPKRVSGRHAADLVESGMTLGLGTGSTVFFTLERLAERIRDEGLEVCGVPTSVDTHSIGPRIACSKPVRQPID